MLKIFSWNVNGLRAVINKGALQKFIEAEKPDILCLQETKAKQGQAEIDLPNMKNYGILPNDQAILVRQFLLRLNLFLFSMVLAKTLIVAMSGKKTSMAVLSQRAAYLPQNLKIFI